MFKCDARTGQLLNHRRFQNQRLSSPQRSLRNAEICGNFSAKCGKCGSHILDLGKKKKTNKPTEFWRDTPWCASRLSRGHVPSVPWYVPSVPGTFCPFSIDLHINQAQMSQVSLGRPEFVPVTPPGHPDRQIPLCDFSLSVFFSPYGRQTL